MSKPPIDWFSILLMTVGLTAGIPVVVLISVVTKGVLPILFVCCLAFSYGRAKWRQSKGLRWYE